LENGGFGSWDKSFGAGKHGRIVDSDFFNSFLLLCSFGIIVFYAFL
jgi:hypothetical protein